MQHKLKNRGPHAVRIEQPGYCEIIIEPGGSGVFATPAIVKHRASANYDVEPIEDKGPRPYHLGRIGAIIGAHARGGGK